MPVNSPDAVGSALHAGLDAVAFQQEVIADNVANIDTPGFRARQVQFQDAFATAVSDGTFTTGDGKVNISVSASPTPVGVNGNNVDLQSETMAAMQAQYTYQLLSRAVTDRNSLMTTVSV